MSDPLAVVNMLRTIMVLIITVAIYSVFKMCQGLVDPRYQREARP